MIAHVLLVEDDEAFRGLAARMLADLDIGTVAQAGTATSARELATRLRPVAALIDVGLPDGDGIALALELAAAPWAPRVLLTSSDEAAGVQAGPIPFVAKEDLSVGTLRRQLARYEE